MGIFNYILPIVAILIIVLAAIDISDTALNYSFSNIIGIFYKTNSFQIQQFEDFINNLLLYATALLAVYVAAFFYFIGKVINILKNTYFKEKKTLNQYLFNLLASISAIVIFIMPILLFITAINQLLYSQILSAVTVTSTYQISGGIIYALQNIDTGIWILIIGIFTYILIESKVYLYISGKWSDYLTWAKKDYKYKVVTNERSYKRRPIKNSK